MEPASVAIFWRNGSKGPAGGPAAGAGTTPGAAWTRATPEIAWKGATQLG